MTLFILSGNGRMSGECLRYAMFIKAKLDNAEEIGIPALEGIAAAFAGFAVEVLVGDVAAIFHQVGMGPRF